MIVGEEEEQKRRNTGHQTHIYNINVTKQTQQIDRAQGVNNRGKLI